MYIQIDEDFDKELENAEYFDANTGEKLTSFGPVSNINLFVGANNSGKSRVLRNFLRLSIYITTINHYLIKKNIHYILDQLNSHALRGIGSFTVRVNEGSWDSFIDVLKDGYPNIKKFFIDGHGKTVSCDMGTLENIKRVFERNKEKFDLDDIMKVLNGVIEPLAIINEIIANNVRTNVPFPLRINGAEDKGLKEIIKIYYDLLIPFFQENITKQNCQKIYIPILRTATNLYETYNPEPKSLKKHSQDIFKNTVLANYKLRDRETHGDNQNEVFTGLGLYKKLKRERNSKKHIRDRIDAFEKFLSEKFFQNKQIEVIAEEADSQSDEHITIYLDNRELPVHSLGDGIQSLIILLYPIFMAEPNTWVFIEEPEINLHPGMQRIFLEQLTKDPLKSKNLKYFITTHSNHLLDLSIEMNNDVSVFTFDKRLLDDGKAHFDVKNVKSGDTDILNLLGVKNSSVFMANCTVWVEGITDRYYIREFLKAYHKKFGETEFKEDLDYAFFEYAGANIEHYIFENPELISENDAIKAQFLSNKILLVADKDKSKEARHAKRKLAEYKNFKFELLDVREVENLLSPQNLTELLPKTYSNFKQGVDFSKIKFKEYKDEYLAQYLKSKYGNKIGNAFIADSGTIATKYKLTLAMAAKNNINWDNMSAPAQQLTKNIYNFIKEANS